MLSSASRARLAIVLVGARNPHNIGAAARAMQDFGFSDLRVVNSFSPPFEAAQLEAKSAVGAASVMASARQFASLAEAIADCTLVAGTTAVGTRGTTREVTSVQAAGPLLRTHLAAVAAGHESRVALLFGSEKTGLTNEQLSYCSLLLTIPMFAPLAADDETPLRHLSMNLGQAVAVCLYELTREGFEGSKDLLAVHDPGATGDDRERLTQLLLDVLQATGYTRRFPANASEPVVRQLVQELGRTHREAMTWMGILRQVLWSERQHPTPSPPILFESKS